MILQGIAVVAKPPDVAFSSKYGPLLKSSGIGPAQLAERAALKAEKVSRAEKRSDMELVALESLAGAANAERLRQAASIACMRTRRAWPAALLGSSSRVPLATTLQPLAARCPPRPAPAGTRAPGLSAQHRLVASAAALPCSTRLAPALNIAIACYSCAAVPFNRSLASEYAKSSLCRRTFKAVGMCAATIAE